MTHETEVLKNQNPDYAPLLADMQQFLQQAAQQGIAVHEVELSLWRRLLQLGHELLQEYFARHGSGDLGETITLPDGRACRRLPTLHPRRYVSIFGQFTLQRTVYGSRECQAIDFVPLDNRLQLPAGVFSQVLQDWDQALCVEQAFGQAARTVERILGLKQSVDSLEHMNVQMAQRVDDFREERPRPEAEEEGAVVVCSADGKGIVMRRGAEAPRPAVHRSKGEKASRKEMAIVGAVYTVDRYVRTPEQVVAALFAEEREPPGPKRPTPCHKQTVAHLAGIGLQGSACSGIELTYTWLLEELRRRNRGAVKEMVQLCDGQEPLWKAGEEYLPRRNRCNVLDLLHVTPRLWKVAHVFHAEGSIEAEQFVRERVLKVLQGKAALVIRGLREMGTKRGLTGNKKKTLHEHCSYLENNLERMRYDEYLAKGYPIASGVIEGACRHLVKDRMERAGMHWTRPGAQAMLEVRSIYVNGDWEEYQAYRIKGETRQQYPYRALVQGDKYSLAA
jgi:hypothetical protein